MHRIAENVKINCGIDISVNSEQKLCLTSEQKLCLTQADEELSEAF